MNVALPALVVFFILLPGFILRSRFKRAEQTSLDYSPFGQVVTEAVLCGGVAHLIWLGASQLFFHRTVDMAVLLRLLSADLQGQARAADVVSNSFNWVALYFVTLFIAAYSLPTLARRLVIRFRLDRANASWNALFRFHKAPWYYLLTGADFDEADQPDFIRISAIVNVAGKPVLYRGVLEEYFLKSDGELDRLILEQVSRRPILNDKSDATDGKDDDQTEFYQVDGDYFVLRYSETITLNVEYFKIIAKPDTVEPSNVVDERRVDL